MRGCVPSDRHCTACLTPDNHQFARWLQTCRRDCGRAAVPSGAENAGSKSMMHVAPRWKTWKQGSSSRCCTLIREASLHSTLANLHRHTKCCSSTTRERISALCVSPHPPPPPPPLTDKALDRLYKQANHGDCTEPQPWKMQIERYFKWFRPPPPCAPPT